MNIFIYNLNTITNKSRYINGVQIHPDNTISNLLAQFSGLNTDLINNICNTFKVPTQIKTKFLSTKLLSNILNYVEKNYLVRTNLKRTVRDNIKRLIKIKAYRGIRHNLGLPSRGQRTHTNSYTQKKLGKRRHK
nr:ribosomal protein S13 [Microheliella maris]